MRRGGSVSGAVSLVMIFCVLCLAVFATLTYAAADRERQLAELTARRAAEYYAADAEATRVVAMLARGETPNAEIVYGHAPETAEFAVPINDAQELHVSVALPGDGSCRILDWSAVYVGTWETDDIIEIWDGDF